MGSYIAVIVCISQCSLIIVYSVLFSSRKYPFSPAEGMEFPRGWDGTVRPKNIKEMHEAFNNILDFPEGWGGGGL